MKKLSESNAKTMQVTLIDWLCPRLHGYLLGHHGEASRAGKNAAPGLGDDLGQLD
jgi:hypothetical protein